MAYFSFFSIVALISFSLLFSKNDKANHILFYFIAIIVGLLIGLRGVEDEVTKVFVRFPALFQITTDNISVFFEKGIGVST